MDPQPNESSTATVSPWYISAMEHLVEVVQLLSQARDLETVQNIVRSSARALTGADGATFVLRDGDQCYYADEDAISPLWKGQRFPMNICISGWVMLNAQPAVIEDIFQDPRIPADAYRPTFVKSLAMVPIRKEQPIGAIGNYWAEMRQPSDEQVAILQALANVTSVTMENIELYNRLNDKMAALEASNKELNGVAWSLAHDLKSPLNAIDNLTQWLEEDLHDLAQGETRDNLQILRSRARRMGKLLDDLLDYCNLEKYIDQEPAIVDGRTLIEMVLGLTYTPEGFDIRVSGFDSIQVPLLPVQRILNNLVNNAIKHHDRNTGNIEIHVQTCADHYSFSVKDDGPGIEPGNRERIFHMFQTLQPRDTVEGSGMGLAFATKILRLYGGQISVDSVTGNDRGSIFRFTWPLTAPLQ